MFFVEMLVGRLLGRYQWWATATWWIPMLAILAAGLRARRRP